MKDPITDEDTDVPIMETEECDLGDWNIDEATGETKVGVNGELADGVAEAHACTTSCKVTDKSKWRCHWEEEKDDDGIGQGKYVSKCEWLCGNKKVDRWEDEGQYVGKGVSPGGSTDTSTMIPMDEPEECDLGGWRWAGQDKGGYIDEN